MRFRDESRAVVKRGQARAKKMRDGNSESQRSSTHSERESLSALPAVLGDIPISLLDESPSQISAVFPSVLNTPGNIESRGVDFFLKHYVRPGTGFTVGNGSVIELLGPMVGDAVVSLGLAGLSNVTGDENMMQFARAKHASALSLTIVALQDKSMVNSMPTLTTAILLALFAVGCPFKPGVVGVFWKADGDSDGYMRPEWKG